MPIGRIRKWKVRDVNDTKEIISQAVSNWAVRADINASFFISLSIQTMIFTIKNAD